MSALFPAGFMVGLVVAMHLAAQFGQLHVGWTRRSMATQEAWDAQPRSIELMRNGPCGWWCGPIGAGVGV